MHPGVAMSELDDFLTPTLARQIEAEQALVNGDPAPRLAMTSINDPVTGVRCKSAGQTWMGRGQRGPSLARRAVVRVH